MSIPISLTQMPEDPMNHILEYLDFPTILVLRKVCHDLRNFIDDTKPASHLAYINVKVCFSAITLNLYLSRSISSFCIDYVENGDGCLVKCVKEETFEKTIMEDHDFVTVFCKDFDIVMRHQKTELKTFHLSLFCSNTVGRRVLESVNKTLKSLNHPLQVKMLFMNLSSHDEIMTILPYMDSKSLERIYLRGTVKSMLNLDEIGKLEQWKQAKQLEVEGFQLPDLSQNIKHFSKITFWFQDFSAEKLILLKEIFLCSSTLTSIDIYENYSSDSVVKRELIEVFGEPYEKSYWFFF